MDVRWWAPGVASATVALHEGEPSGDAAAWFAWAVEPAADGGAGVPCVLLAIIDGLGHGPEAAAASQAALQILGEAVGRPAADRPGLPGLLRQVDRALTPLRGAAVGLVQVCAGQLQHLGVGNTRVMRWRHGHLTRLPSYNGIVGGGLPAQLAEADLALEAGDWLLLFTDGLDERLSLPVLLPEWERDPSLFCQFLLHQHRLGRDDAGVLVMQVEAG